MSSTTDVVLLDANVLIAFGVAGHEYHSRARAWFGASRRFAICSSTQGSLIRYLVRVASTEHAPVAIRLLDANPRHEFWPDGEPHADTTLEGVFGHRQVTDAYLAGAAARRNTTIATFDAGLAALRPATVLLIP